MLVQSFPRRATLHSWRHSRNFQRRGFISETIGSLGNGFVDLALASPFAPTFPAYTSTIVVLTLVSRMAITLPVSVWVRVSKFWPKYVNDPKGKTKAMAFGRASSSSVTGIQRVETKSCSWPFQRLGGCYLCEGNVYRTLNPLRK